MLCQYAEIGAEISWTRNFAMTRNKQKYGNLFARRLVLTRVSGTLKLVLLIKISLNQEPCYIRRIYKAYIR